MTGPGAPGRSRTDPEWVATHWGSRAVIAHEWVALDWGPAFQGIGRVVNGARRARAGAVVTVRWYTGTFARYGPHDSNIRVDQCRPATSAESGVGECAAFSDFVGE